MVLNRKNLDGLNPGLSQHVNIDKNDVYMLGYSSANTKSKAKV